MSESPSLCMFCANAIKPDELSMEHFVPKCLWEKGRRPKKMRTLPAHKTCNASFSEDNEYFRTVLVLERGASENSDAAKAVCEATIQRMFVKRPGTLCKVAKNLAERPLHTRSGVYLGTVGTFEIEWRRMERVLFNVMKGIFQTIEKNPMPPEFELEVCDIEHLNPEPFRRTVEHMVPWQSFGDDAFDCRYIFARKPPTEAMACLMRFYRNRTFYGCARSPQFMQDERERMKNLFVPSRPNSVIIVPRWVAE